MTPGQRIVLNTVVTFLRTIFHACLALFSSRWVLAGLGHNDFGTYTVVGSLVVFISFLNSVMAGSASRHFAFAVGRGDVNDVNRWFNAAISVHVILGFSLVLLGFFLGEYAIGNWLTIPENRSDSIFLIFRVTLVGTFFGMISVPFISMFIAQQKIVELAICGICQSLLTFLLAWFLTFFAGDRLLFYVIGMTTIQLGVYLIQVVRALLAFQECQLNIFFWYDTERLRKIFSFAVWNLIGTLGALFRNQGTAILLNIYFGTKVNAAYGIANQVSTQTNNLSAAMIGAFAPEITASEGRGDRQRMISLSLRACKMGTLLVLLFAVPLLVEMDFVLKLWLTDPPQYTSILCKFIIITFIIDRLTSGYMIAVNAHGRIAAYQATVGTILLMTLPLAWFFLHLGWSAGSVGLAFVITMSFCSIGRIVWVKIFFDISVFTWVKIIFYPCFLVFVISFVSSMCLQFFILESFFRLVITIIICIFMVTIFGWAIALNDEERAFITINVFKLFINKY